MNYRWRLRTTIFASLALAPALAQKSLFDIHALLQMKRVGEAQVSPDSKLVAFSVSQPDIEKNGSTRQIWIVPIDGGVPKPVTTEGRNERPMWAPDSKKIAFTSTRSGASQVILGHGSGRRECSAGDHHRHRSLQPDLDPGRQEPRLQ